MKSSIAQVVLTGVTLSLACRTEPLSPPPIEAMGTRSENGRLSDVAAAAVAVGGLLPDVEEQIPYHLQVVNTQQGEWLRFSATVFNVGAGKLQIRGGGQVAPCDLNGVHYDQCTHATQEILNAAGDVVATNPAGVAIFHPAHNHWHQNDVTSFILHRGDVTGPVVAEGAKITFCLIDYDQTVLIANPSATRTYFACNGDFQGITPGFGDSYHHSTEGQELEITGFSVGDYTLEFVGDPTNHWVESDDSNNSNWTSFFLSRQGANPEITITGHSPCDRVTCGNSSNK